MEIITKPLGPVQANSYLLIDNYHSILIDPGDEYTNIDSVLDQHHCDLEAILLTHAHFDHIGGVDWLCRKFDIPVYLNSSEFEFLSNPTYNSSENFMMDICIDKKALSLEEGMNQIGHFEVEAIFCPGHSIGSTVFKINDCLFTGDVLFQGSIGRTDLYSGSNSMMFESLKKLSSLEGDYPIYPGHGPSTSLFLEKNWNEYLKYAENL